MTLPGGGEWLIILLIVLLLFGAKKLPELARSMGRASKEFREGVKEGHQEESVEGTCPFCSSEIAADSKFCPGCGKPADEIRARRAELKDAS
jgi:sec-independent protein translocase protein TatA